MSEQGQEQNKSEQATPYKLAKAREKGAVARGMDLGFLVALTAAAGFQWIEGPIVRARLADVARQALISAPDTLTGPLAILTVTGRLIWAGTFTLVWLPGLVFAAVLVFELVQTGAVFSTDPLRLDFSRLNPANGFKRVFSMRILIEAGKNILKMLLYGAIAVFVVHDAWVSILPTLTDAGRLADALAGMGLRLLMLFCLAAAAFAALDQLIVRRDFQKRMRMSRREIRRELRDREGDPRLKQRRRQLHRQFVKLSKSLRNIRDADVLITNPTHFAVALRYDARTMTAPVIVSQATNQYALRLKRMAFIYGVTIIQNPPLARSLCQRGQLEKQVPEQFFRAVAEIYITMRNRRTSAAPVGQNV